MKILRICLKKFCEFPPRALEKRAASEPKYDIEDTDNDNKLQY